MRLKLAALFFFFSTLALPWVIFGADTTDKKEESYPVEILDKRVEYFYTAQGLKKRLFYVKYKILNKSGAEEWNSTSAYWSPWYQKRPIIKATITTANGKKHELSPSTIVESAASENTNTMYDNSKILKAPLPGIDVNCIVEETIILEDSSLFFLPGGQSWESFNRAVPVKKYSLTINLPEKMPFAYKMHLQKEPLKEVKKNGRRILSLNLTNLPAMEKAPEYMAPEDHFWPAIEFSTVKDWKQVADKYSDYVKKSLESANSVTTLINTQELEKLDKKLAIKKLIQTLHSHIRYTGLELGAAAIIPASPDDVIKRKYGDCKDKAVLLVALLKKIGVTAHVALLNAGNSTDVSQEIAGLEFFNHAIVYIPAPYNIWVDATAEYTPFGELPPVDLERYALIIDSKTQGLVRTPAKDANKNKIVLIREIFPAQLGKGKIKETYLSHGAFASYSMSGYATYDSQKIQEIFTKYAKQAFGSENVVESNLKRTSFISDQFHYTITASDASTIISELEKIQLDLVFDQIIEDLPESLRSLQHYKNNEELESSPWRNRQTTFLLSLPYYYKLVYKIHIPEGFQAAKLPEAGLISAGSAAFKKSFSQEGNVISAKFEFISGRGRFSPPELKQLRQLIADIYNSKTITINLVSSAMKMVEEGKIREALSFLRQMIKKYPQENSNYIRFGNIMVKSGFREDAIGYFKKAIKMNEKSTEALMALGWAYLHDSFGRYLTGDFKLKEAKEIYTKIISIDENFAAAWRNLAVLSEHNAEGLRYAPDSDMTAAVKYYQEYRKKTKASDLDYNYLLSLFVLEQYQEIIDFKTELKSEQSWLTYFAAQGITHGVDIIFSELEAFSLTETERAKVLKEIVTKLIFNRYYELAEKILLRLGKMSDNSVELLSEAHYYGSLKKWQAVKIDTNLPEGVILNFFRHQVTDSFNEKNIQSFFLTKTIQHETAEKLSKRLKERADFIKKTFIGQGNRPDAILDHQFSSIKFVKEGDETTGYRIKTIYSLFKKEFKETFFVFKENGEFRLADADNNFPEVLGLVVEEFILNGKKNEAIRILDWLYEGEYGKASDSLAGHPFYHFWKKGNTDEEQILISASLLLSANEKYNQELMKRIAAGKNVNIQLYRASWLYHYIKKDFKTAMDLIRVIHQSAKDNLDYRIVMYSLMINLNNTAELEKKILDDENEYKESIETRCWLAIKQIKEKKFDDAVKTLNEAHAKLEGTAASLNLEAWIGLFVASDPKTVLDLSFKSNRIAAFKNHAYLHTLSTIYAEVEKVAEATQILHKILENSEKTTVAESDYYILARNAETLGLPEVALRLYKLIKPDEEDNLSVYALAQKRIEKVAKQAADFDPLKE